MRHTKCTCTWKKPGIELDITPPRIFTQPQHLTQKNEHGLYRTVASYIVNCSQLPLGLTAFLYHRHSTNTQDLPDTH